MLRSGNMTKRIGRVKMNARSLYQGMLSTLFLNTFYTHIILQYILQFFVFTIYEINHKIFKYQIFTPINNMENHEFWVLKNLLLSGFQIGPSFQVFIFRPETRGRLKCYIETRVWLTSLSYCTVIATMQCYIETINIYTETRGRLTSLSSVMAALCVHVKYQRVVSKGMVISLLSIRD